MITYVIEYFNSSKKNEYFSKKSPKHFMGQM